MSQAYVTQGQLPNGPSVGGLMITQERCFVGKKSINAIFVENFTITNFLSLILPVDVTISKISIN